MKASFERKLIRWLHILIGIPVVGFIYGPVAQIPRAAFAVRFIFFPILVLSGLWLWKSSALKKCFSVRRPVAIKAKAWPLFKR
jgi:thiosulfate reductase cytochrome b subunit